MTFFIILLWCMLFCLWGMIGGGLGILLKIEEDSITLKNYPLWFILLAGPAWWIICWANYYKGVLKSRKE